jgi:uncharacterized protein YndB with AHSA1/START domain
MSTKEENQFPPGRELKTSILLSFPIVLVWEVWTDPGHIKHWWGPDGITTTVRKMDVCEGGEWLCTLHGPDGKSNPNKSIYREIVPLNKIVFEHFNPGFIATIVFEPRGKDTFLEWSMLFPTTELFDVVVSTFKADEGQKQNLVKLEKYLMQLSKLA